MNNSDVKGVHMDGCDRDELITNTIHGDLHRDEHVCINYHSSFV